MLLYLPQSLLNDCVNKLEEAMKQPTVKNSLIMNLLPLSHIQLPSAISKRWAIKQFGGKDSEEPLKNINLTLW